MFRSIYITFAGKDNKIIMMKRLILSVLMALTAITTMQASRAYSEPQTVRQPDGSMLTVTLFGDEDHHWMALSDGTMVVNTGKGYFVAQIDAQGAVTPTAILAHEPSQRTTEECAAIALQADRKALFHALGEQRRVASRRASINDNSDYFPHSGNPKVLVILAQFQDTKFTVTDPVKSFDQFFNAETLVDYDHAEASNYSSVRKYFDACSHGLFNPVFTVVGPVTVSQNMEYYGSDTGGRDKNVGEFYTEITQLADPLVDYKEFDNGNTGKVEAVVVIYAGFSQSVGAPSNTLWPKTSSTTRQTNDGVSILRFSISAELNGTSPSSYSKPPYQRINGIGVCAHEFSHAMGLPDVYPNTTASQSVDNQTMEYWDLMDYGEYLNNGRYPTPYTAWEQETMGWLEVEELTESQEGIQVLPVVEGESLSKAYKFTNGGRPEEWFFVENIQQRGYHTKAYGHGLVVTHVAYNSSKVGMSDYPNNVAGKPRMTIVPADGLNISGYRFKTASNPDAPYTKDEYLASLAGDPFPGTKEVTTLTAEQQLPNYQYYYHADKTEGKEDPVQSLVNIVEDTTTGIVTFDFKSGAATCIRTVNSSALTADDSYYDLQGRRLDGQPTQRGLYIVQGKKVVIR